VNFPLSCCYLFLIVFPAADTIVALSTPPGRSAIGVIRLSGSRSLEIARILVSDDSFRPKPTNVGLRNIYDPVTNDCLDQALITYFEAPHSFTGEDVIEISCHGSPVLLRSVLDIILRRDARAADPGEFTLRALAHGRMSLTQAEAVRDLIDAQTNAAVKQASRQLHGEVSHVLQPVKETLLEVIVRLESSIEFVEEDLPPIEHEKLAMTLQDLQRSLEQLAATFQQGRLLSGGVRAVLLGRPNVGKSSVFNGLLAHERAIVTELPGTTRDTLTESIDISGIPVLLTDTAGLRSSKDRIELIGVERARRAVAEADIAILVIDGADELTPEDYALLDESRDEAYVIALNKKDLPSFDSQRLEERFSALTNGTPIVAVSAKTKEGLDALRAAILKLLTTNGGATVEGLIITNARHYDLLARAVDALRSAERLFLERASEDLVLVGLHSALSYLGQILGETTTDDILAEIFSTFCIGK
jgi:tRNA modification GTPase